MDPKFLKELGYEDCNLYYSQSFVRLKKKKEDPFQWTQITEFFRKEGGKKSDIMVRTIPKSMLGVIEDLQLEDIADLDFSIPPTGLYNFRGSVICWRRLPHRQNKKTVTGDTIAATNLMLPFFKLKLIPSQLFSTHIFNLSTESLNELFGMKAIPVEKCLEAINKQQVFARSIDGKVGISQGVLGSRPTVWFMTLPVGSLDPKSKIVKVENQKAALFKPELEASLNRHGIVIS